MRIRRLSLLAAIILVFFTGGCNEKDTADKYVGEQITAMKEEDAGQFSSFLDEGIAKSNSSYVLQFPDELRDPYLTFLQKAFSEIEFEIKEAKDNGENSFSVLVTYTPLDIAVTAKDTTDAHLDAMSSPDLNAETAALLEECGAVLQESPVYGEETHLTIDVKKEDNSFSMTDASKTDLLSMALTGYMEPYNSICEILNERDALQAYLDASFKGEFTQFMKHTGKTEEEAAAWYDGGTFDIPEGMDGSYTDRYKAAMQDLLKQCIYTVGIPKKADWLYSYTDDVTVTPNTSFLNISSELSNMTFYSEDEVDQAFVSLIEKYAAAPTYGEETVVTVPLNMGSFSESDTEIDALIETILPYE